ncbi:MAG TPA: hypothetical protein VE967_07460 [Gemmatimonadaceae bacterium]|nr:hypothetical protein [Gemmatimonadaceae bacterium]
MQQKSAPVEATTQAQADPQAAYEGAVRVRDEIRRQISDLVNQRSRISDRISQEAPSGADRAGLEERMTALDKQLVVLYEKEAAANAEVARAVSQPGVYVPSSQRDNNNGEPPADLILASLFIVFVLAPLSVAMAIRLLKRKSKQQAQPSDDRLARLEATMESVAIEVERIGEGQRFVTNLLIEGPGQQLLGAGAMEPVDVKQGERVRNG